MTDVSLSLEAGSVTALVGENGAGKSTLAGLAAGLVQPDSGELLLDGELRSFEDPAAANSVGVCIAPQELVLCPDLSVAENVLMGVLPTGFGLLNRRAMTRLAQERLDRLGVTDIDVWGLAGELTVVEQTFVQIARALAPGARVLIVDEPTATMTTHEADRFIKVLRNVTEAGVATIYVSHHLDEVARLADVAVVLRDGRLAARLERHEITHDLLIAAMLGGKTLEIDRREASVGRPLLAATDLTSPNLFGISLTVHAGEIVAVYGIAGSGREELGSTLVGLRRTGGQVRAGQSRAQIRNIRQAIKQGVGYVPPERRSQGLALEMSVAENICMSMFARLARRGVLYRSRISQAAEPWIDKLDIATPTPDKSVGLLSGGSQQKALLARSLANGSEVLVLEEPTRGVDIGTKAEIHRLLRATADEGRGVLVLTSDIDEVVDVADRVVVLRRGRIAAELRSPRLDDVAAAALVG